MLSRFCISCSHSQVILRSILSFLLPNLQFSNVNLSILNKLIVVSIRAAEIPLCIKGLVNLGFKLLTYDFLRRSIQLTTASQKTKKVSEKELVMLRLNTVFRYLNDFKFVVGCSPYQRF